MLFSYITLIILTAILREMWCDPHFTVEETAQRSYLTCPSLHSSFTEYGTHAQIGGTPKSTFGSWPWVYLASPFLLPGFSAFQEKLAPAPRLFSDLSDTGILCCHFLPFWWVVLISKSPHRS